MITSCASTYQVGNTQTNATLVSENRVILDIEFIQQESLNQCGYVAVAVLGKHLDSTDISVHSLIDQYGLDANEPLLSIELPRVAKLIGIELNLKKATLEHLIDNIYNGVPTIVALDVESEEIDHYSIVVGVDEPMKVVYLHDGISPYTPVSFTEFTEKWNRLGNLSFSSEMP